MFKDPQVNYYVKDAEASARFYRDLLGFEESFRTPTDGSPVHIELRLGGLVLGFATLEAVEEMHGVVTTEGPPRSEVVVWTDDVDAAHARLSAGGAATLSPPHDFLHLRAAWVADFDGNPVQLVSRRT